MNTEQNPEDYVLVHKTKAKISRARKMVIGVMAIGAVAAMTNAGTFASFSASTTNDGVFRTGRVELTNKVNTGSLCYSTGTSANGLRDDANLDNNEAATCTALFGDNLRPGVVSTANVEVANTGTYTNGVLYAFGTDDGAGVPNTCDSVANVPGFVNSSSATLTGSGNICDAVEMTIQEYTDSTFGTAKSSCIFPQNDGVACTNLTAKAADAVIDTSGQLTDFTGSFTATQVNTNAQYLGAFNNFGGTAARYFRVTTRMPSTAFTSTGYGPDNVYQNLKPDMKIRWILQDSDAGQPVSV